MILWLKVHFYEFEWCDLLVPLLTNLRHICVSELGSIVSGNGLSPVWCQAVIWTNAGILLTGTLGINFSEIWSKIYTFSFKKNAFENVWKIAAKFIHFYLRKCIWKYRLRNGSHFVQGKCINFWLWYRLLIMPLFCGRCNNSSMP